MEVGHHKGLNSHCLYIESAEEGRMRRGWSSCLGGAEREDVEEEEREAGEVGTLGVSLQTHITISA